MIPGYFNAAGWELNAQHVVELEGWDKATDIVLTSHKVEIPLPIEEVRELIRVAMVEFHIFSAGVQMDAMAARKQNGEPVQ